MNLTLTDDVSLPGAREAIDVWSASVEIARNNFKYKSLSSWSCNTAVGCEHGCTFCYVPEVSTRKLGAKLKKDHGVEDPDADWGSYVMLRPYNDQKFMTSLGNAHRIPHGELNADGNRAVMFCTTTDPYQVIRHKNPQRRLELQNMAGRVMQNALSAILNFSDLNVRILTRSPLATKDFGLFKEFGKRLMFGMSIPTLDNKLARIYEPHAPSPTARFLTLSKAKEAGLNIYAAMAPTYPECDKKDIAQTLAVLSTLNPHTIFHEPINIRAGNIDRIAKQAEAEGFKFQREIFDTPLSQAVWARKQFDLVETTAGMLQVPIEVLHLWPDQTMPIYLPKEREWLQQQWRKVSAWPK